MEAIKCVMSHLVTVWLVIHCAPELRFHLTAAGTPGLLFPTVIAGDVTTGIRTIYFIHDKCGGALFCAGRISLNHFVKTINTFLL